jgi:hypothetical protein
MEPMEPLLTFNHIYDRKLLGNWHAWWLSQKLFTEQFGHIQSSIAQGMVLIRLLRVYFA